MYKHRGIPQKFQKIWSYWLDHNNTLYDGSFSTEEEEGRERDRGEEMSSIVHKFIREEMLPHDQGSQSGEIRVEGSL